MRYEGCQGRRGALMLNGVSDMERYNRIVGISKCLAQSSTRLTVLFPHIVYALVNL